MSIIDSYDESEEIICKGSWNIYYFWLLRRTNFKFKKGAFIIPTEAYRDEGTSYHYIPISDFIEIDTATELVKIFEENGVLYELAKTWTTDALYKETKNKLKDRVSRGCKVVEMECASIMAVAKSRGFKAYQFLYTDDTLEDDVWHMKTLTEDRTFILKECLNIAFEVIKKI